MIFRRSHLLKADSHPSLQCLAEKKPMELNIPMPITHKLRKYIEYNRNTMKRF